MGGIVMYAAYPIYYPSVRWARENGEIELWRESFKINKECKAHIFANATHEYHSQNLPELIKQLTDLYGLERVMFVIGRTIIDSEWEERYDKTSRERAGRIDYQDMKEARAQYEAGENPCKSDVSDHYLINIHPVILNTLFRWLIEKEQEQVILPDTDQLPENELDEGVEQ
jgi:hypothetical protein